MASIWQLTIAADLPILLLNSNHQRACQGNRITPKEQQVRLAKRPNGAQEQSASILDLLSFIGFSIFLFFKDLHNAIALEGMRV